MADYLKLFMNRRLSTSEPHHLEYIKARLAHLKVEDEALYDDYSKFYGVEMEVSEKSLPKMPRPGKTTVEKKKPEQKKSAGRPKKQS